MFYGFMLPVISVIWLNQVYLLTSKQTLVQTVCSFMIFFNQDWVTKKVHIFTLIR